MNGGEILVEDLLISGPNRHAGKRPDAGIEAVVGADDVGRTLGDGFGIRPRHPEDILGVVVGDFVKKRLELLRPRLVRFDPDLPGEYCPLIPGFRSGWGSKETLMPQGVMISSNMVKSSSLALPVSTGTSDCGSSSPSVWSMSDTWRR